jgi:chromosomal replication initiation ATPase DnaA
MSRLALRLDEETQDIDTIRRNYARVRAKFTPKPVVIRIEPQVFKQVLEEPPVFKQVIDTASITNDWVQRELEKWNIQKSEKITFKTIMREVAIKHRIPVTSLKIDSRSRPLVDARQECFYRLRHELNMTMHQIGTALNRDHSTVMHGIQQFTLKNKETINDTSTATYDTEAQGLVPSSVVGANYTS